MISLEKTEWLIWYRNIGLIIFGNSPFSYVFWKSDLLQKDSSVHPRIRARLNREREWKEQGCSKKLLIPDMGERSKSKKIGVEKTYWIIKRGWTIPKTWKIGLWEIKIIIEQILYPATSQLPIKHWTQNKLEFLTSQREDHKRIQLILSNIIL